MTSSLASKLSTIQVPGLMHPFTFYTLVITLILMIFYFFPSFVSDRIMGQASDNVKLTSGSVIEVSRLPGYVLQTKGEK